ncbi:MAG TPA: hypothetical protein VGG32_01115 [Thermoplasmata archaeon]
MTANASRRKRPALAEGLAAGIDQADVPGMAAAIGEGLVRVSEAWLPKQKLAVPQRCPVAECAGGPYSSLVSLRTHMSSAHAYMTDRERSFALDRARRTAVRQAMNGAPRPP